MPEPTSQCGACKQTDDAPKHQIMVGFNNQHTDGMFHKDDADRDGQIFYHFDCPTPWHSAEGVDAEYHQRLAALANSGVRGDALRERILGGQV